MEINVLSENELSGDTSAKPAPAAASPGTDPNFSVTLGKAKFDGLEAVTRTITWGEPMRTMVFRDLSLGDQFELVSIADADAGNSRWMAMASLAFAVSSIDGEVAFPPRNKSELKKRLNEITEDGVAAYIKATQNAGGGGSDPATAAKNS